MLLLEVLIYIYIYIYIYEITCFFGFCLFVCLFLRQYDSTIFSFFVRIEYLGINDAKRRPRLNTAYIATVFSRLLVGLSLDF